MKLIVLYGPAGVGKHTIGTELAKLTDYRFFHNHYIVDLVSAIFQWGTKDYFELSKDVSEIAFRRAVDKKVNLITTYVYATGHDDEIIKQRIKYVEKKGGTMHFVQLTCSQEALEDRVQSEGRKRYQKLTTVKGLRKLMKKYDLITPIKFVESLEVDTTNKSPKTVAKIIKEYCKL